LWGSRLQATKEKPTFKYLDIPDDQLDETQLKEKRKERMFKGAYEARERARAAKLAEQKLKVSQSLAAALTPKNLIWLNHIAHAT